MKNSAPVLGIVSPCFNEEEALPETYAELSRKLAELIAGGAVSERSFILFVDDGSEDATWDLVRRFHEGNPALIGGLKLSGNRGQQFALLSGLLAVKDQVDMAISIDADLQDDMDAMDGMISKYKSGFEIVYGVRSDREADGVFKRVSAQGFYRFMRLMGAKAIYNHADFRLLGRKALANLEEYGETNLFLRGIIPLLGYKTSSVYYRRRPRRDGRSKYPLGKMLRFALEGITSFSIRPMRFITAAGALILLASVIMIVYCFVRYFSGHTVSGWTSLACSIWSIGGLMVFSLGVIGEYIGKIYLETKRRPKYHIEQYLKAEGACDGKP